jgi:hypothetical protein
MVVAIAPQPVCLSCVHRDNFMGGVDEKGTKQHETG